MSLVEGEVLRAGRISAGPAGGAERLGGRPRVAEVPERPCPSPTRGPLLPREGLAAKFEASALQKALQSRLDLEEQALRHQEGRGRPRWSLQGLRRRAKTAWPILRP